MIRLLTPFRWLLLGMLCSMPVHTEDFSGVIQSLTKDIQAAQTRLSATEKRIAKESAGIYRKLNRQQDRVAQLRDQVAVAKRMADEQTLGLEQLQSRLKTWQDQHRYQQHLLLDFAEKISASATQKKQLTEDMSSGLALIKQSLARQVSRLNPTWQEAKIVSPQGLVQAAQVINIGPVAWFWQTRQQHGGLAVADDGLYKVAKTFQGETLNQLSSLYENNIGHAYFDPSLDRALKVASQEESLLTHIQKGGVWVLPILGFALLALAIAAIKVLQLWRLPRQEPMLAERIDSVTKNTGDAQSGLQQLRQNLQGAQADLVAIVADTPISQQRDERLFACLLENRYQLEKFLGAIAITAAVSPLLGLLGTVSGMIETFKLMTIFGAGDPSAVSGGISEALVTTELGLVVAIPALILHALISRHIRNHNEQLETTAVKLGQLNLGNEGLLTRFEQPLPETIFSSGKAEGEKFSDSK